MDYDEEIIGEAPCEFCGELYPLILLIEHESIHLADEDFSLFNLNSDVDTQAASAIKEFRLAEKIEKDVISDAPVEDECTIVFEKKKIKSSDIKIEPQIIDDQKQMQSSAVKNEKCEVKCESEKIKEFTTESGEKLLVYGCDIDPDRDLEIEKQIPKMPNNPLLSNFCEEKDVEDINNLSDDDISESLEEFWKRARDVLKRNRVKADCS